jgi:hypothetical protein
MTVDCGENPRSAKRKIPRGTKVPRPVRWDGAIGICRSARPCVVLRQHTLNAGREEWFPTIQPAQYDFRGGWERMAEALCAHAPRRPAQGSAKNLPAARTKETAAAWRPPSRSIRGGLVRRAGPLAIPRAFPRKVRRALETSVRRCVGSLNIRGPRDSDVRRGIFEVSEKASNNRVGRGWLPTLGTAPGFSGMTRQVFVVEHGWKRADLTAERDGDLAGRPVEGDPHARLVSQGVTHVSPDALQRTQRRSAGLPPAADPPSSLCGRPRRGRFPPRRCFQSRQCRADPASRSGGPWRRPAIGRQTW